MATSRDLQPDALRKLRGRIERDADHLQRLVNRCEALKFPVDDPLAQHAAQALAAMKTLARTTASAAVRHGEVRRANPFSGSDPGRA